MDETDALIDAARERLVELGLDVSLRRESAAHVRADATVALRLSGSRQRFAVYARPAVRLREVLEASAAAGGSTGPVLVVARWISAAMGARLREAGICFLDSVGNAWIRFGAVHIEISGRPRPPAAPREAGSLLTPANRRVIAALLADPALEVAPLRELAAAAGVSVGQAHKSVTLLAEAGYPRDRLDPAQRAALADVLQTIESLGG